MALFISLTFFFFDLSFKFSGVCSSYQGSSAWPQDGHAQVRHFQQIAELVLGVNIWWYLFWIISLIIFYHNYLLQITVHLYALHNFISFWEEKKHFCRNFPVFVRKVAPDSKKTSQKVSLQNRFLTITTFLQCFFFILWSQVNYLKHSTNIHISHIHSICQSMFAKSKLYIHGHVFENGS